MEEAIGETSENTINDNERTDDMAQEVWTVGGGCFWCVEAVFLELKGVLKVESGYSGGMVRNPTYEQVCTGRTGHAEVVQVTIDPQQISAKDLLRVFFTTHDPTQLNRQGADVGTQYRSVVFFRDPAQRRTTQEVIEEIERARIWNGRIVTTLEPFDTFYRAEEYHQNYFAKNPYQGYCRVVIAPKVAKLRKMYKDKLKKQ
ncbi:MAG: peptide-methionine (S)-S-oxide reductase MsrA [Armatimonadaceae bacterium]